MEKSSKVVIWSILGLGLGLRLIALNQSFWMDEAITATVVKNFSLINIVTKYIASDTHPPLYYLLLHLWSLIFGYSEISLRLPSVIFGVFTIYVVYKIGQLFSRKTAITSAILMAVAPLHVYYSQEARMYSLTTLLVCISVYYFLQKKWLLLSLFLLLVGISDYLPLLIIIPLFLFTLLIEKERMFIINFIKSLVPLIIFLILWFPYFTIQSVSTSNYLLEFPQWKSVLGSANIKDLLLVWVKFIIGRVTFENKFFYAFLVIFVSAPFSYLLTKAVQKDKKYIFIWLWFVVPIITAFLGAFLVPGFSYFRLIFVLPAFYQLIGFGLNTTKFNNLLTIVVILLNLSFSLTYLLNSKYWREDWKAAVPFIENRLRENEIVLVSYVEPFTPYTWYSKNPGKVATFDQNNYNDKRSIYTLDYLMDLTDSNRENYKKLRILGFLDTEVYNFRGVGQVRHWTKI